MSVRHTQRTQPDDSFWPGDDISHSRPHQPFWNYDKKEGGHTTDLNKDGTWDPTTSVSTQQHPSLYHHLGTEHTPPSWHKGYRADTVHDQQGYANQFYDDYASPNVQQHHNFGTQHTAGGEWALNDDFLSDQADQAHNSAFDDAFQSDQAAGLPSFESVIPQYNPVTQHDSYHQPSFAYPSASSVTHQHDSQAGRLPTLAYPSATQSHSSVRHQHDSQARRLPSFESLGLPPIESLTNSSRPPHNSAYNTSGYSTQQNPLWSHPSLTSQLDTTYADTISKNTNPPTYASKFQTPNLTLKEFMMAQQHSLNGLQTMATGAFPRKKGWKC